MKHKVIGIDLGTTYSAVATYDTDEEQAEVIVDHAEGDAATTPSVVTYDRGSGKVIVGHAAKRNLPNAPEDTIIEIKREMGELEDSNGASPAAGEGTGPPRKVSFANESFLPQEISAFTLMKMKEIAEAEIGEEVRDAVITIPAWFTENQRGATKEAALLAGMYPRQLIPEPTAAAICYGVDRGDPEKHAYLVFDLGGGTFDVSIITAEEDRIEVIATAGDRRLGGSDFDNSITRWAVQELKDKHGLDVSGDPRAREQIKYHAEQAKIRLGAQQTTELVLPELRPTEPPALTLSREELVELITADLNKSKEAAREALKRGAEKGVGKDGIDAVLLVGGSTKMPEVKDMLLDYFQRDESFVRSDLDPAAVVARGAALLGYRFQPTEHAFDIRGEADQTLINPDAELALGGTIGHIAEHSLGVGVQENRCVRMIERQTTLPTSQTQPDFTNPGPTPRIEARVFQGEGELVYENTYIGTVVVDGLEPKPAHSYRFEVTYSLDENGLLEVQVKDADSGKSWDASFEHGASVKAEELPDKHERLKRMFASREATASAEGIEAPAAEEPYEPPPPSPTSGAAVTESPRDTTTSELVDVQLDDVPEEFRTYVRRARRQLERAFDAGLATAFNALANAINAKAPVDELTDLGDDLTEALDEAKRSRS